MARPRMYTDPKLFDMMVDLYVADRLSNDEPLTHVGLALHLGFCSRQALYEYMKHDDFYYSAKRACSLIEDWTACKGYKSGGAMAIFMLKNMGYTDKHEVRIDPINIVIKGKYAEL